MDSNNRHHWTGILESLLFAAGDEGLTIKQISKVMDITENYAETLLKELATQYEENENRGLKIAPIANTYQLVTKKEHAMYLQRLVETPSHTTLSQAALETLTIIAYKQPITKAEIEEIRGVKTDRPIQTLAAKGLIQDIGRLEGAGRAILYGTTKEFLDYFGLKDIGELPPLPETNEEEFVQEEADLFFGEIGETSDNEFE